MADNVIELVHLQKQFGDHAVLRDINLSVKKGEVMSIIGASGSGKSTMLRCINLLETPSSGQVLYHGQDITAKDFNLIQYRTKVGMVFQSFNLFNNMTVLDNCTAGLRYVLHQDKETAQKTALENLEKVGMAPYIHAKPRQLSGGQKQRVAIARALACDPKVLLCDEATSALDPQTTNSILRLLKQLNQQLGLTVVVITHEMAVVKEICNRVAVMEHGKVAEEGEVFSIFAAPKQPITQSFIKTTSNLQKIEELIAADSPVTRLNPGELIVRLSYVQRNVSEPLISSITERFHVSVNIIFADIEIVQDAPIGGTVAIMGGKREQITQAIEYLIEKNVGVEVIRDARAAE